MNNSQSPKPWHPMPDEPPEWYDHFHTFMSLPPPRTLSAAYRKGDSKFGAWDFRRKGNCIPVYTITYGQKTSNSNPSLSSPKSRLAANTRNSGASNSPSPSGSRSMNTSPVSLVTRNANRSYQ